MCRLLIDTNIMLDATVPQRPGSDEACEVLNLCNGNGEFGMACALSFKDVYYIVGKRYGEPEARKAIANLLGLLVVAPVDAEVLDEASRFNEPDFEDGIVRACAELNGADFIITRDKAAFAKSKVRAVSAAEYLEIAS
jgi:predicted nucleic acid-binding protein